jgi:hypothetical protein
MKKGRKVEKGEGPAADDEVSCRCSMILREYQKIAKRWGREEKQKWNTRPPRTPKNFPFQSFILDGRVGRVVGRESSCGMWLLRRRRRSRSFDERNKARDGQSMLVVGMCTLLNILRRGLDDARLF